METESEQNTSSSNGSSGGSARPQISQMSLYERQAVQALQALQRQPNAAQYFHQIMLQQQLSNAQLHSLAAVQQATIAASRQASSPNTSSPQQTSTSQASMSLATTSATQLINRSQSVSSPGATTLTQSVLLGNTTSPPLNQSQAQMYLRQPQLGNLLQVNRTLGRSMPLASQLILMPSGAVATVQQQEVAPQQSQAAHSDVDQVQNLAVRGQQPPTSSPQLLSSAQKATAAGNGQSSGLPQASGGGQSLNLSQTAGASAGAQAVTLSQPAGGCQGKGTGVVQPLPTAQAVTISQGSQTEIDNGAKKAESEAGQSVGMNLTRTATPAPSQTLISSATYTQLQPHSLIQQQQQIHLQQKQVVIQQQIAIHHQQQFQHRQSQLLHTATHLQLAQQQQQPPAPQAQTLVVQPMVQSQQAAVQIQPQAEAVPSQAKTPTPVPIQPKQPTKTQSASLPAQLGGKPSNQPHIPVQVVGGRQQGPAQALGLAQVPVAGGPSTVQGSLQSVAAGCSQGLAIPAASAPMAHETVRSPIQPSTLQTTPFFMQPSLVTEKPHAVAVKRKAEAEEGKEEVLPMASLATKLSPGTESPKSLEEKEVFPERSEAAVATSPLVVQSTGVSTLPCTPSLGMVSRQNADSKPPQAIVKPQILTHIIEGFVIQEGAEPFPVGCSQLLKDSEKQAEGRPASTVSENPCRALGGDAASSVECTSVSRLSLFTLADSEKRTNLLMCEYCSKYAPSDQFRGSKRFCSMTCAKRYNVSCSHHLRVKRKKLKDLQDPNSARARRRGPRRSSSEIARAKIQGKRLRAQEDSSRGSDNSSYDEAFSPAAGHVGDRDLRASCSAPPPPELLGINPVFLSSNPNRWSVEEVYEFIASLQGCQEIAEDFRSQEIDGQALLLLKEEHLMSAMNMKLGPALKICAKINVLKET
ncbi:polyhomeotic-like protein 1 isoform X2 [Microcaecilia unicolor]|uniref:Polyhomeotic-like protein 1 isoform X2 n=1 Tax=Microcaecilia unicolor TaxID=1415580 RepID=A0A6P7WPS4_9AMPH|nr:polyhomeotic-like protein 1 isoform X2 [Microcaecilia unicolor]